MTDRLDAAIAKLQHLPDAAQNRLADAILELIGNFDTSSALSDDQVAEVRLRRESLRDDRGLLASDDEMKELWAHCGL